MMTTATINQARAAIGEYNAEMRAGGEPHYPPLPAIEHIKIDLVVKP